MPFSIFHILFIIIIIVQFNFVLLIYSFNLLHFKLIKRLYLLLTILSFLVGLRLLLVIRNDELEVRPPVKSIISFTKLIFFFILIIIDHKLSFIIWNFHLVSINVSLLWLGLIEYIILFIMAFIHIILVEPFWAVTGLVIGWLFIFNFISEILNLNLAIPSIALGGVGKTVAYIVVHNISAIKGLPYFFVDVIEPSIELLVFKSYQLIVYLSAFRFKCVTGSPSVP